MSVSDQGHVYLANRDQHFHYGEKLSAEQRTRPGAVIEECPYPGLSAFGREQRRWFFGRKDLTGALVGRLDRRLRTGGLQVVIAPSGAGKSSLLHAGLLPALDQAALPYANRWPQVTLTPTATPVREMAGSLERLTGVDRDRVAEQIAGGPERYVSALERWLRERAGDPAAARIVVVVDQFEELFTECDDEREREAFVELLVRLAATQAGLVVIGVRDDFHSACAAHPLLQPALEDRPLVVGPMPEANLREAIVYPAQDLGVDLEPGLAELLLGDLRATAGDRRTSGYEAGRLPLLAHALRLTWQQRNGATLTVEGYKATGRIEGALAATAEQVFTGLDDTAQRLARLLFLRLVKLGDGAEDTRRRVAHTDLVGMHADPGTTAAVVNAFAGERLLTLDREAVQITHEALLSHWPRLRGWLNDDRAGRLIHQDLEDTAAAWSRERGDSSRLYRGTRLDAVRVWAETRPEDELTPVARDFLAASARQRRRTARLRTGAVAALTVLALVASVAAVYALQRGREAITQRDLAVYQRVVAEADRLRETDISLSAQLTLVAHRMNPGEETRTRLLGTQGDALSASLTGHVGYVESVVFSPDGRIMASGDGSGTVRLWDVSAPALPKPLGRPLSGSISGVSVVAFSPDGHLLAAGDSGGRVQLWDLSDRAHIKPTGEPLLGHIFQVTAIRFTSGGNTMITSGADGVVQKWDLTVPSPLLEGRGMADSVFDDGGSVSSTAVSADGKTLAVGTGDAKVHLFDISDVNRPKPLSDLLEIHRGEVKAMAFSPNGRTLATIGGAGDAGVLLWDVSDPTDGTLLNIPSRSRTFIGTSVAFSPNGRTLAATYTDWTVRLWNVSNPSVMTPLGHFLVGHTGFVTSAAFSPDGRTLASGASDGSVRLWNAPSAYLPGHTETVTSVAFGPGGRLLASAGVDRSIILWDVSDPLRARRVGRPLLGHRNSVASLAFGPDGHTLVSSGADGDIRLWDVTDPARATAVGKPLRAGKKAAIIYAVAFDPTGDVLAAASGDGAVRLWDVAARKLLAESPGKKAAGDDEARFSSIAFGQGGRLLASINLNNAITLWDVSDPARLRPVGRPLELRADATSRSSESSNFYSVTVSPDGHTLAASSADGKVYRWDITDPARATLKERPLTGHTGVAYSVLFSPDGRTMASSGFDGVLRLWDMTDPAGGKPLGQPLLRHTTAFLPVAFDRTGGLLAGGSDDGAVWLWTLDEEQAARRICAYTRGALDPEKWRRFVGEGIPYDPPCP
ncbi:hypothetical protein [Streptosporangium sp. NPDC049376]|uniref:nSTAND1 domain-containing NTPase n=1 Tax=Streptosporangium sp. NPDC049376 TaxID=3366192 RepID=UPI0037A2FE2C